MEIKNHFGVYGVCYENGKLLCIEKTRGPYQHRFDLPGGSQEAGEGLTETLKREVLEETAIHLAVIQILGYMMCWFKKRGKTSQYIISWPFMI